MDGERQRLRAVFDCMVFLQGAARQGGPSGICLQLVDAGAIDLFVSNEIIAEIRDVLNRPRLRRKFSGLTDHLVDQFLAGLLARASHVRNVPRVFVYERDPKDEPYINLALAAQADYLVSRDTDILDLGNLEKPEGRSFQEQFPKVKIVEPVTFLRKIHEPSTG